MATNVSPKVDTKELVKRLRIQAALALEEKANAEALFASIGQGIIVTDVKGTIIRVNQSTLNILGYHRDDILGKWFPDVIIAVHEDGSLVNPATRPVMKAFMTGKTMSAKSYYKTKSGQTIPVALVVSPVLLRKRPVGAIQVFRDITDEVRAEKLMSEFIGIASHQLRTPLTAVSTYSQMLKEGYAGTINESQMSFIDVVIDAAGRMNDLISTLLNITRIEAGNIKVESRLIPLAAIVKEIIHESALIAEQNNIKLEFDIPSDSLRIKSDRLLVREIFASLLSNALKYTGKGGTVHISLYARVNDVIFKIEDTGYGIPQKDQPYIFTKFFRSSNILEKDVSGTGLGLYLTKNLVESVDGEIWFNSRKNHGTTFYVSLPLEGTEKKSGKFTLEV